MPSETQPILRFAKLTEHAFPPTKGSEKAAGFDLKRFVPLCSSSYSLNSTKLP